MKTRKILRRIFRLRNIVAFILVVLIVTVLCMYYVDQLNYKYEKSDNIEFLPEEFKDMEAYRQKDKTEWYLSPSYTGDLLELNNNVVIGTAGKYKMFFDEDSTIVTVVDTTTLIAGQPADNPNSYKLKYTTADPTKSDRTAANVSLSYFQTETGTASSIVLDSYTNSVSYLNSLTEGSEKHYRLRYLTKEQNGYDAVQVLYTIGNFSAGAGYFPTRMYNTWYEPFEEAYINAQTLELDEEAFKNAHDAWEEYMNYVGNLGNTFEERFRGNTLLRSTQAKAVNVDGQEIRIVKYDGKMNVYTKEGYEYMLHTVLPDLADMGLILGSEEEGFYTFEGNPIVDSTLGEDTSYGNYGNTKYFKFVGLPLELLDVDGELYKKYFNNPDSPLTNNPFLPEQQWNFLKGIFDSQYPSKEFPYPFYELKSGALVNIRGGYAILYNYGELLQNQTRGFPLYKDEMTPFVGGGIIARNSDGTVIYEDGYIKNTIYSLEQVALDNEMFGVATETSLPIFNVCVEFKITDKGLVTTILGDSLRDGQNATEDDFNYDLIKGDHSLSQISILQNMTNVPLASQSVDTDGYILVPDGSGAIIDFNNKKNEEMGYRGYVNNYYGEDSAYISKTYTIEQGNMLLGMFGFVVNRNSTNGASDVPKGYMGIVEKGGAQTVLAAAAVGTNYAYFSANLRIKESVQVGTVYESRTYEKWSKNIADNDLIYRYIFLDETELDYVDLANIYRNYLIERDGLELKDTTTSPVLNLNFLGSYDKYALAIGIKYKTSDSLTTFNQAQEIIEELKANNVNNFNISYTGWTKENFEYELGGAVKVSSVLGKATSMKKFFQYCVDNTITFYPEMFVTTTKGYDLNFGNQKYSTRSVSNDTAIRYTFDPGTLRQDKKAPRTYIIAPQYYESIATKLNKSINKLKVWNDSNKAYGGLFVSDLGNSFIPNYAKNKEVYGQQSLEYQMKALDILAEQNQLKLSAPYDYAFKYVTTAVDVPVTSSMYGMFDQMIPFYQLVVNGLFDYSTIAINSNTAGHNEKWFLLKAIETGSNINYLVSYEDPSTLLKTDYTYYFQAYYQNIKETMINQINELEQLGIYNARLVNHEILNPNLVFVEYEKKDGSRIGIYINSTNMDTTYEGKTYPKESYKVKGEED